MTLKNINFCWASQQIINKQDSELFHNQRGKLFRTKQKDKQWIVMSREVVVMKTNSYLQNYKSNLNETWTHDRQDVYKHIISI